MERTALITGVNGQDGAYLARLLLERGTRVFGLVLPACCRDLATLEFLDVAGDVEMLHGDLSDPASLVAALRAARPDEVYNLAAQSFVGAAWERAAETARVNALGVLHLLEAVRTEAPGARVFQASSAAMFGDGNRDGVQDEDAPMRPKNPYAAAKLHAYWAVRNHRDRFGLFACNGILFNHESPVRGLDFVTRKITDGVARIACGRADRIVLGDLEGRRDWGFAGDTVEAMVLMLDHDVPDDYVVCTGVTRSVREFCDAAFSCAGIGDWERHVDVDASLVRPGDAPALRGDASKIRRVLGWAPRIPFSDLVRMMVEADLERHGAG